MHTIQKNKSKINWISEVFTLQTQQEVLLRHLRQVDQISSWKMIAKKINQAFSTKTRTSKQCRQRYINFLRFRDNSEQKVEWSSSEDESLFINFIKYGSSWSLITKQMPNRSQKALKNRFYGMLRKLHRKIAKYEKQNKIRSRKPTRFESLIEILKKAHQIECRSQGLLPLSTSQAQLISNTGLQLIKFLHTNAQQQTLIKNKILDLADKIHKSHTVIKQTTKKSKNQLNSSKIQQINLASQQFLQAQCSTEPLKPSDQAQQSEVDQKSASEMQQIQNHHFYTLDQQFQNQYWNQNDRCSDLLQQLNQEFGFGCADIGKNLFRE